MSTLSGFSLIAALFLFVLAQSTSQGGAAVSARNVVAHAAEEQGIKNAGLPTRLTIPSIDVDASVEYVGLTPDGAMDVPKDPDDVAWYDLGARPGQIGTAVMAGHYDREDGSAAVFDTLDALRFGDTISTEDENGVVITFAVRETRVYDNDAIVPEVFISNDGKAHLNLITCAGSWNKAKKIYSERLVVFADKL